MNKYIEQANKMLESLTQITRDEKRKNKQKSKKDEDTSLKSRAKANVLKW